MRLAKRPALLRLWMIDRELRDRTFPTVDELAKKAEVDAKTIRRDIQAMQTHHQAPVEYNRKRRGWEYTCTTYRLPAVIITEGELVAMFLAGQALRQAIGTPYESDLKRAIKKLAEFLPDEVSLHWQALEHAQSFHQTVTSLQDLDIFRQLADAAVHQRRLKIRYWTASRDSQTERMVDPYHLACIDGAWYLIAFCHQRKDIRTFAASRVREAIESGDTFNRPAEFRIGDFFEGTFKVISEKDRPLQTIRLKFAPSAAKYIREKLFHESQRLQLHEDQSITLTLELRSLIEVRKWILSYGSECKVLAPKELHDDILQEAQKMIAQSRFSETPAIQSSASALEKIRENVKPKRPESKKKIG